MTPVSIKIFHSPALNLFFWLVFHNVQEGPILGRIAAKRTQTALSRFRNPANSPADMVNIPWFTEFLYTKRWFSCRISAINNQQYQISSDPGWLITSDYEFFVCPGVRTFRPHQQRRFGEKIFISERILCHICLQNKADDGRSSYI